MPDVAIDIDYAGWAQAGVALIAIAGGPSAFVAIYRIIRTRISAISKPLDSNAAGGSMFWQITLKNKRKTIVRDTLFLYPAHPGVFVSSLRADENDGGRHIRAEIADGCVKINITRLGKGRAFEARIGFSRYSFPIIESENGPITHSMDVSEASKAQIVRSAMAVSHYRLMVLTFQFIAGFGVILLTLVRQQF